MPDLETFCLPAFGIPMADKTSKPAADEVGKHQTAK
jgi:hypothetical protein